MGVSSRLLDPQSGAEVVRVGLAQRYLLRDQNTFLPNASGLAGGDPGIRDRTARSYPGRLRPRSR